MTNEEYFAKLQSHDWFYEYSDDHSVWQRGGKSLAELKNLAKDNDVFATMFSDYNSYINAVVRDGPKQENVARPILEDYT